LINFDDSDSADYVNTTVENYMYHDIKYSYGDKIIEGRTDWYLSGRRTKIIVEDIELHRERLRKQGMRERSEGRPEGTLGKKQ